MDPPAHWSALSVLLYALLSLFRKAIIVKGRSRDTAWFSIIDDEWPQRKLEFETWLQEDNFEGATQKKSLKQIREELRLKGETQ